ncbi:MAG: DUF177 domain-containing protein [Bdellovibrionales bacterium]
MKKALSPLQIHLRELPPEGREFVYDRNGGELNGILADVLGNNPYQIQVRVEPQGNLFLLSGTVSTSLDLECSLCALEFKYPVQLRLNELIVIEKPMAKGDQQTRANHAHEWQEHGPDYMVLTSDLFEIANYLHEMIALSEPLRPLGKPDCETTCENRLGQVERPWLSYGPDGQELGVSTKPFAILEKMKLKD